MSTQVSTTEQETPAVNESRSKNLPVREPHYSIREQPNGFAVEVELPGVAKDAIQIDQKGDELTITAERKDDLASDWKVHVRQSGAWKYRLNLRLGHSVDNETVEASFASGLLRLSVAKRGAASERVITVS